MKACIICVASLLLSLVSAPALAGASNDIAGRYVGTFQDDSGEIEGAVEIVVDAKGRVTGSVSVPDFGALNVKGKAKINKKTGLATGTASFAGRAIKGKGAVQFASGRLFGDASIAVGRSRGHATFELRKVN